MKINSVLGNIGRVPLKGTIVNIDSADTAWVAEKTAGLAKALCVAGATTLGIYMLSKLFSTKSGGRPPENQIIPNALISKIPTSSLIKASIKSGRKFIGICLNDNIEFTYDRHLFNCSLDTITRVDENWGRYFNKYNIYFIDGNCYQGCCIHTKRFEFITLQGKQIIETAIATTDEIINYNSLSGFDAKLGYALEVAFNDKTPRNLVFEERYGSEPSKNDAFIIEGVSLYDVENLKDRLKIALDSNREAIIQSIGKDTFEQYFKIG